jgi:plasmid replication initiation protein
MYQIWGEVYQIWGECIKDSILIHLVIYGILFMGWYYMVSKNKLIVKSNYIVEASYKLSLGEQRVIYVLTSMIKPDDKEFKTYRLTVKEFAEILGTKSKDMYAQVARYVEGLRDRDLTIIKEKSILKTKWLSSAEYFIDDGYVELCFDPKLKPYLLMLKERFTKLSLDRMVSFKSQYSGRIYELLKQYEKIGERVFRLDELKSLLGIGFDEYTHYGLFKQRILSKAKEEINTDSDLQIEFEEIKTRRKVTDLKFYIKSNKSEALSEISATSLQSEEDQIEDLDIENGIGAVLRILEGHKIKASDALDIYKKANGDIQYIKKVYEYSKTQNISNLIGFMKKMVVPGVLQENIKISKVGTFNNYEQRKYDLNSLERQLLGWEKSCDSTGEEFEQAKIIR